MQCPLLLINNLENGGRPQLSVPGAAGTCPSAPALREFPVLRNRAPERPPEFWAEKPHPCGTLTYCGRLQITNRSLGGQQGPRTLCQSTTCHFIVAGHIVIATVAGGKVVPDSYAYESR